MIPKDEEGGASKPTKKKPAKKKAAPKKPTAKKPATTKKPKTKGMGATAFATSQLKAAGIKPKKGTAAQAQFRAANKAAAKRRTAAKLGTIAGTGASSNLAAGNRQGQPRPRLTAEQFATSQLKAAGIKVGKGDVKAQFRAANKAAAQKRAAAGLGKPRTVGASTHLAAGLRGAGQSQVPKPSKKPSAAKSKAQGY